MDPTRCSPAPTWAQVDGQALTSTTTMRSLLALVSLASCTLAQRFNVQDPIGSFPGVPDLGRNVTTMHLSELGSTDDFTTLVHPKFPGHQVRVKKTKFCDPTVKFVSHLLKHNPRHLTNATTKCLHGIP